MLTIRIVLGSLVMFFLSACDLTAQKAGLVGDACSFQEDCASNLCAEINGGICTQYCDSTNPCPNNYECKPTTGTQSVCSPIQATGGSTTGGNMTIGATMAGTSGSTAGTSNNTMGAIPAGNQGGMGAIPAGNQGGMGAIPAGNQGGMGAIPAGNQGGTGAIPAGSQGGMGAIPAGNQGGNVNAMDQSCLEVIQCLQNCQDAACSQSCLSQGTPQAQQLVQDLASCIQASNCPQNDNGACVSNACANEISACQSGTTNNNNNNNQSLSCSDLLSCLQGCNDDTCSQNCFNQGTPEGQQLISDLSQCLNSANCTQNDSACFQMACSMEITACQNNTSVSNPNVGSNLDCKGFLVCLSNCSNDQNCQQACARATTQEGMATYQTLSTCYSDYSCQDNACLEANCRAEYDACVPPGVSSCSEVLTCLQGCSDNSCQTDCVLGANDTASALLDTLAACLDQNACADVSCAQCSNELSSCQQD